MKSKTRSAIDTARALETELTDLGNDETALEPHEIHELSQASGDLKAAWDDLFPERSDLAELLEEQRAEQWWHRKLIATFPIAVFETDLTGRVLWANAAWASLLNLRVLQIVRTDVRRYFDASDQANLSEVFTQITDLQLGEGELRATLRVASSPSVLANVEITVERRPGPEQGEVRDIATWVVEPHSEITQPVSGNVKIAHIFSRLGLLPLRSRTNQELLNEVIALSTQICPEGASVSLVVGDPQNPTAISTSSQAAQTIDGAQLATAGGPTAEVWQKGESVLINERAEATEWSQFWEKVPSEDLGSVASAPITVGDELLGVLSVYAPSKNAFDQESFQQIELFAEAVGAVLHHVDEEQQLRTLATQLEKAMRSREVIAQAKGILMAKYSCTAEDALGKLKQVSQDKNIRVRVLAEEIVASVTRRAHQAAESSSSS